MGTDVHPVFQKKVVSVDGEYWEEVESNYDGPRHYQLFGWLADVRNGYGFAGRSTGDALVPLAEPRGFPDDFNLPPDPGEFDGGFGFGDTGHERDMYNGTWLGDHSHSWLTSTEILAGLDKLGAIMKTGVIPRDQYKEWDKRTPLTSYSGGVGGPGIVVVRQRTAAAHANDPYGDAIRAEASRFQRSIEYRYRKVKCIEQRHYFAQEERYPTLAEQLTQPFMVMHSFPRLTTSRPAETRLVEVYRTKRLPKARPARLKHLKKLQKYAARTKEVYVQCTWTLSNEALKEDFAYFTDEVKRLHDLWGEVRMVFGFDS